jgi:Transglycosylase-like domain
VTVPVAVAAAQDPSPPPPAPAGYAVAPPVAAPHGVEADGLSGRSRANVMRDGAITQRAEHAHQTLVTDNVKLAHKVARARGHKVDPDHVDHVRTFTRPRLRAENRVLSTKLRKLQGTNAGGSASPQLEAIAACESGGDPHSIGGGGAFRGKYQFTYGTWASVGGKGDPAAAPEAEQDKRAQMLLDKSGNSPWPVCGQ